jgi:hypothetical protein
VILVFTYGTLAQKTNTKKFHVSAGPEIGFAINGFSVANPVGLGVSAVTEVQVSKLIAITMYGGYISYKGKKNTNTLGYIIDYKTITIAPVELGMRYSLSDDFYVAVQAGIAFFNTAFVNNKKSGFVYSPAIGSNRPLKNGHSLDIGAVFSGYTKKRVGISSLGLRVAYRI